MSHTYSQSTLPSTSAPQQLTTYSWLPPPPWRAVVFLVHGFRTHAHYNFLRNDGLDARYIYGAGGSDAKSDDTSLIRELNQLNIAVFSHDHIGHGRSTGLRAYFPSFHTLVADLVAYVRHTETKYELNARGLPLFLIGHSMGGTISILAAREQPSLFAGIALSSAATEPPANMFGLVGKINYMLSGILTKLIPKVEVISLPPSLDPHMQKMFEHDELNCKNGIRSRVGREFIDAYRDISSKAHEFSVPFLSVSGDSDTLVNPDAAKRFYDKSASKDKTLHVAKNTWHNLFVEKGREDMYRLFSQWINDRIR